MNECIRKRIISKIIEKYNLPTPISTPSMNGVTKELNNKKVETAFVGDNGYYIFFKDNTVIRLVSNLGWEGELETPAYETEINYNYLSDIIAYKFPKYYHSTSEHPIYRETRDLINEEEKKDKERIDRLTYEQLKRKFEE